jgi:16S rRNA (guanine527-N7)-methyltransferase
MSPPTPIEIDARKIDEVLSGFGIFPTALQIERIQTYTRMLLQWNSAMNLTSVTDPVEIVRRHFGESMFASKFLPVENCRLADVGSGAGFPGLALKISRPDIHIILIESNKKKCAFLSEVAAILELVDVEVRPERFEQIRPETILSDIVTSRAVGDFKRLLLWSKRALVPRGHMMLWLGAEDSTRISTNSAWTWQPSVHIPDTQRRFVLIGTPKGGNPSA